jgi:hypothetical protein
VKLTNDCYTILLGTRNWTERYSRDEKGWLKVSARGRKFRATAEQVLNHLLPALAGVKGKLEVRVEYRVPRAHTGSEAAKKEATVEQTKERGPEWTRH